MTNLYSLTPTKDGQAPWLYSLGDERFLDLTPYASREDWAARRRDPILKWSQSNKYLLVGFAIVLAATGIMFLTGTLNSIFGTIAGFAAAGLLLLDLLRVIQARRARTGLIAANVWTPMGEELDTLGRVLDMMRQLQEHTLGKSLDAITDQLDPDAAGDMAKHSLQVSYPDITPEDVSDLSADILAGVFNVTGIRVERS